MKSGRRKRELASYPTARPYTSPNAGRRTRAVPDRLRNFYVPLPVLEATSRAMRRCGVERRECYVWWGGHFVAGGDAQVVAALCPDVRTEFGHIHLTHSDLVVMHEKLRELDLVLVAELHTHPPGAGGQNDIDAANAAASYRGFISIVVPDFGAPRFYDLRKAHVYEYEGQDSWRQLHPPEVGARFIIEEAFHEVRTSP